VSQGSLFGPDSAPVSKPPGDSWAWATVLITVKAAPNPSETYGETVCVAGIRLDLDSPGWVRLYPINFRDLETDKRFRKYDVVRVKVKPARNDPRIESFKPDMDSVQFVRHLRPWDPRRPYVDQYVQGSMCSVYAAAKAEHTAPSLAAIRPAKVLGVDLKPHPGWDRDQQRKIEQYVSQMDLYGTDRTPLEAPRMQGWYRYRCAEPGCSGHRHGILDWEFVALQRTLAHLDDDALQDALRAKFFDQMCAPDRDVVFFVGNQAKRHQTFGVIGVYYPRR
jgi:hypothetical protein